MSNVNMLSVMGPIYGRKFMGFRCCKFGKLVKTVKRY
jgi:hypothetical protein